MRQEERHGNVVKYPKGVLQVAKRKDGRRETLVSKGTQAVVNVAKQIAGRNTNVLQVKSRDQKAHDGVHGEHNGQHFFKNKEDIPKHRRAAPSLYDPPGLSVAPETGE